MNGHHERLFEASVDMCHCIVVERVGQCISFELFKESDNTFLLACVKDKATNGTFLLTTFRDSHLRGFSDMVELMKGHDDYVGKISRDWVSGLSFSLVNRFDEVVCDIKFISSVFERLPISFKMKIYAPETDDVIPSAAAATTRRHAPGIFSFSCFADTSCLETAPELPLSSPLARATSTYTTIESNLDSDTIYLQTRKPIWNREINHWVHNFGGRVRIPSNKNFLVVQTTAADHYDAAQYRQNRPGEVATAADAHLAERVCIRHGKRTTNTYILDFRAPVSAVIAFAAMCATHAAKPLVNA